MQPIYILKSLISKQEDKTVYIKPEDELKNRVWQKAKPISNENPDIYRIDKFGNWIAKNEFEKSKSLLGWKISKINPLKKESVDNLEPLFWKNVEQY